MVSLLDITPSSARHVQVEVRGQKVDVNGISLGDIAYLIQAFPEVKDLFSGKDVNLSIDDILQQAPGMVYELIACGTGSRADTKAIGVASNLSIEEQAELMEAIMGETFKGGLRPFVERVKRMLALSSDTATKVLPSSGQKQPRR